MVFKTFTLLPPYHCKAITFYCEDMISAKKDFTEQKFMTCSKTFNILQTLCNCKKYEESLFDV